MNRLNLLESIFIYEYMSSCTVVDEWLSSVADPVNKKIRIPNRSWTDGVYYWSEMTTHFVKEYRILLPSNFIYHIYEKRK
jgi:pyridoxal biosynthesis lyase PdxS